MFKNAYFGGKNKNLGDGPRTPVGLRDFWWKLQHMLSITPSLNLCHQLIFLNLINPIEIYAFANTTNLPLTKFINQQKSLKIYSHFVATLELNFSHTGSLVPW